MQIVDFDGESLRRTLPRIVLTLEGALSAGGRVYIHCTAGLGRAPAACIAWLYWFGGRQLDEVCALAFNIGSLQSQIQDRQSPEPVMVLHVKLDVGTCCCNCCTGAQMLLA